MEGIRLMCHHGSVSLTAAVEGIGGFETAKSVHVTCAGIVVADGTEANFTVTLKPLGGKTLGIIRVGFGRWREG